MMDLKLHKGMSWIAAKTLTILTNQSRKVCICDIEDDVEEQNNEWLKPRNYYKFVYATKWLSPAGDMGKR